MQSVGEQTYSQAVKEGKYDLYVGNLFGKYDNVRTYWEDQLTRIAFRPFLLDLVERRRKENRGVRILDLGCGSGQGYEILVKIDSRDLDLGLQHERVLPEDSIDLYYGVDISQPMVDKGEVLFADKPNVKFAQLDLREGLGRIKTAEKPFDIYFSSYAALSHLSKKQLRDLLQDISQHGTKQSLVVLDLVGRYSIEWPQFWSANSEDEKVRDYTMSYLYSEPVRESLDIEKFPLRFWTGNEVKELAQGLTAETGVGLEVLKLMDRSILVGRHTDTREYNQQIKPIRRLSNCLHEDYFRTDLQTLMLDERMVPNHPEVSPFLHSLIKAWNILVDYTQKRLRNEIQLTDLRDWDEFPKPLHFALMTMDRVIADVGWMWYGDPRANIIEPQLGYALRTLEYEMQTGMGCGHGLLAILQLQK
ncbi:MULTISPECIES: class I SAM-dependent methyltransferase [Cyanophyceae]|uniref:Methyltransferase type 12 n=1 Tax=Nodularia spumigena CENA596 TaxID=1819295 RepID=A0A166K6T7_NODSP|nr:MULTISPECIES: class I SAM-dependent methyltransferase [Cyanophyceae]MDB9357696.1 class I SAM-dependent methyltransferase [Nodularia spumigena CS-587/03]KZL50657.1 methyltransferase type 12 [Nodularia spumigena CENA596]MDB9304689.1 class I SAM-dependent methyltransferase [Nodularia spumigena CS-591/12]MDB9318627.1 class I SAM-dependent methyltransferase [Nodularia spumigena CS-590/01A]MDB9324272.1 class I SAM-dependent methyltransferase [Nodularia spumigena CS-591/07A]